MWGCVQLKGRHKVTGKRSNGRETLPLASINKKHNRINAWVDLGCGSFFAQISADPAWVEGGRLRKGWCQE